MHPEDEKSICWLTMLYGVLLLALYLLLSGCSTSRGIANYTPKAYVESAGVSCPFARSSLNLASACA